VTDYVLAAQERADMAFMNVAAPSSSDGQAIAHVAITEIPGCACACDTHRERTMKDRQPTKQPDMKPVKAPPETRRGGGYGKGLHDTSKGWLHGGRGEDHPNFDKGHKGKQQKIRKWPY
jgi:hypothetical protein